MTTYTIGALATMAGISVRTLHHYDDVGLLPASGRTDSGYRTYSAADIDRLFEILTYRELGLGLAEIADVVDAPASRQTALEAARARTNHQITRLTAIRSRLDIEIAALTKGTPMTPEEKLSVFGDFDPDAHTAEAEERWGSAEAFAESSRRTSSYTVDDWAAINAEAAAIYTGFHTLATEGRSPHSAQAAALVDEHRAHITHWFYDCTREVHSGLGQMYDNDLRFAESIDKAGPGTAAFMSQAIAARYES